MKISSVTRTASLFGVLALFLVSCGAEPNAEGEQAESDQQEVTITVATGLPEDHSVNDGFWHFVERLEENAPWITVDYRGGPEVMDANLMFEGVVTGAFDAAHLPSNYYVDQVPAMDLTKFTPFTPPEERDNGIYDLYVSMHEDYGVRYLGHNSGALPQVLFLTDDIQLNELDLTGLTLRGNAAVTGLIESLGGAPVDLPADEIYTALERGTVDGTNFSAVGPASTGLQDVLGYYITPRVYESITNFVMNQDTWNSLDEVTQDVIEATMAEMEPEAIEHYQEMAREEQEIWHEAGMESIDFTGEEAEEMLRVAYENGLENIDWDRIAVDNEEAQSIREIFEEEYEDDFSNAVPGGTVLE